MKPNQTKELSFSGEYIDAKYIENAENYSINNRTIVINPQETDIYLSETSPGIIPSFSSTILNNATIAKAESLLLLRVFKTNNLAKIPLKT